MCNNMLKSVSPCLPSLEWRGGGLSSSSASSSSSSSSSAYSLSSSPCLTAAFLLLCS